MDPSAPWFPHLLGRRRRRRLTAILLGVLVAATAAEAVRAMIPPRILRTGPRTVEIPAQRGLLEVAWILADEGVIRSRPAFVTLAVLRGTARSLKAGEYEIPRGASLLTTLQLLESGRVKPHLIVHREGATVRDLAQQLEAEGIAPAAEVLRVASAPFFVQSLGIEAPSVEGYLYPDTYQVTKGMRVEEILGRMVQRLREKVGGPAFLARAAARGLTLHELLTLASIIEKEAVDPDERPLISAVFWNRLRRNMPLQADPTVAYAVGKDGRAPTRDDLQVDHPFNTYRYRGLPPGPIASPGLASIQAVVAPARVGYLFFVAMDDRHHYFSSTLEEHNEAVARYRQSRRARAG